MNKKLIYVVDDEQKIRELIKSYLIKEGYEVDLFADGEIALSAFLKKPSDMLIIDIMMPGIDGYSLCKEIRKTSEVPIIMVSAKDEEIDKIIGLELGSDDYIAKPFSPRELVVRVKTIFRRIKEIPQKNEIEITNKLKFNDICVLIDERSVLKDDIPLDLTTKEYELLLFLIENKNRVFTREQLINKVWGYEYIGETRAIDDLVKRIRKKLYQAGSTTQITTVWGYGYKVVE